MVGKLDENLAMCTGGLDGGSPEMEKELFLISKPRWVPKMVAKCGAFKAMPIQERENNKNLRMLYGFPQRTFLVGYEQIFILAMLQAWMSPLLLSR